MADILIPDVPDEVVAAIDLQARRLNLSRVEHLRQLLAREAGSVDPVTVEDLGWVAETFADLKDPAVMAGAWRCGADTAVRD